MKKEIHPYKYPVEWPNSFLSLIEEKGAEVTSHDIIAVQNVVKYDIVRKLEYSEQWLYVLWHILIRNRDVSDGIQEKPHFLSVVK